MLNASDQGCRVTSAAIERRHCYPGYCLISYRAGAWHYRILPDFLILDSKWLPKQRVKQRSLRAIETILRARLLQKVNLLQQRIVVLLLLRTSIKNLEKRKI